MPTDFSFVKPEGWEALKPHFERAEKKLQDKVKKKEIKPDQAQKLTKLMWDKYDRWSSGEGMKKKEDQTVLQQKPKRTASMTREARLGQQAYEDILGYIADGTIQNSAVFQDTLRLNHATSEQEFFDLFAKEVREKPTIYPRQFLVSWNDLFSSWGYGDEMRGVMEAGQRPMPQAPATPAPRGLPGQAPESRPRYEPAEQPAAQPAAQAPAARPVPKTEMLEPHPWPQDVQLPPPSRKPPVGRWYAQYRAPGDQQLRAGVLNDLNLDDVQAFLQGLQKRGYEVTFFKFLSKGKDPEPQAAPAAAPSTKPPLPAQTQAPAQVGNIEEPDPKDPNVYRWYVRFQAGQKRPSAISPDMTGAEAMALRKRYEQMGLKILEMTKMNISSKASIVVSDSDIRLAEGEGSEDKFRNGTPIIFTEDVNLEFDALDARGQIKKNMTGKIKKVEDNDYLIDIAGQLYRVPRLVAEHVMDVFAANVVSPKHEQEQGQQPGQQLALQPQETQAPAAEPAGQAAGQPGGQFTLPQAPATGGAMAAVDDGLVVVLGDEVDDGIVVIADIELEAGYTNTTLSRAFAEGSRNGKGSHMFIDDDTIYSYGRHFPIATRGPGNVVYLTTQTYSSSTARHVSLVRNALSRQGIDVVMSDEFKGGKVAAPSPGEIALHEQEAAEGEVKRQKSDERRELIRQKNLEHSRVPTPEQAQEQVEIEQPDERGVPLKDRVDPRKTWVPKEVEQLEELPSLSTQQWQARIQDMEDQLHRETDPNRQEKLRQRLERMKHASWDQAMARVAGTENPMGGELADFDDLHKLIKKQDKNVMKQEKKEVKLENKLPQQTAAASVLGFADLLMMIESGGPGIPSEIGKRLYRADSAVSRISA